MSTVWSQYFNIEGQPELARRLSGLVSLALEIRRAIELSHPNNLAGVSNRLNLIEQSILMNNNAEWTSYWTAIEGDVTLDFLNITASLLDASDSVSLVISDVAALRQHMADLIEQLRQIPDAQLSATCRAAVERQLRQILDYLDNSQFTSTGSLIPVVEGAAGSILGDHTLVEKLMKTGAGQAILGALVAWRLFVGGPLDPHPTKAILPPADSTVIVLLESNCYSMPQLTAGSDPLALEPGVVPENSTDLGK